MPRRAAASTHLLAGLRAWFGLDQTSLALYLGVSPDLVHAIEGGRRALSSPVRAALLPLLQQLPPPEARAAAEAGAATHGALPAQPAPSAAALPGLAAPPDAAGQAGLALRQRQCRHRATRLLAQAAALARQARVAARWQAALPALLATAEAAALPADPAEAARAAGHTAWLASWLRHRARPLPPEAATRYHRLRAQAIGLLAEAAALATGTGDD